MFLCLLLDGMTVALTVGLLDVLVFHADASKHQGHAMLAGTVRTARRGDCARTVSGPMTGHDARVRGPVCPTLGRDQQRVRGGARSPRSAWSARSRACSRGNRILR